jgi:hypothetical protein
MYSILDWFRANQEVIEPLIFLLLFYGIAHTAFPSRHSRGLALALGLLLGFSYLEWSRDRHWELMRWGLYATGLIYLVIYCAARNFHRNTKTRHDHQELSARGRRP